MLRKDILSCCVEMMNLKVCLNLKENTQQNQNNNLPSGGPREHSEETCRLDHVQAIESVHIGIPGMLFEYFHAIFRSWKLIFLLCKGH